MTELPENLSAQKYSDMKNRFIEYFIYELKDTVRNQGLAILLTGIAPVILFIIHLMFSLAANPEFITLYWGNYSYWTSIYATVIFMLFFLIFPIARYGRITDKRKGTLFIQIPVRAGEKFLSAVLVSVIIVPCAFMALYFASDALVHFAFPAKAGSCLLGSLSGGPVLGIESSETENSINVTNNMFFLLPFTISSAGLAGAVMFRKNKIFMTVMTCAALLFLFEWLTKTIVDDVDPEKWRAFISGSGVQWTWAGIQTAFSIICLTYFSMRLRRIRL